MKIAKPQVDLLVERTEGWPAALVLAGLWPKTRDDPDDAVRDFGGDHRFLAEYLSREVMAAMDDDRRSFTLAAAVLGQVTPDLCDAVLGRTDSAAILSELEHSNLFVERLEEKRGTGFTPCSPSTHARNSTMSSRTAAAYPDARREMVEREGAGDRGGRACLCGG